MIGFGTCSTQPLTHQLTASGKLLAILWTIWLNRNEAIIHNKHVSPKQMKKLIIHRSYMWCINEDILRDCSKDDWDANPMLVAKITHATINNKLLQDWDYIGFIDGSWQANSGISIAGVGGYIKNSLGDIVFYILRSYHGW